MSTLLELLVVKEPFYNRHKSIVLQYLSGEEGGGGRVLSPRRGGRGRQREAGDRRGELRYEGEDDFRQEEGLQGRRGGGAVPLEVRGQHQAALLPHEASREGAGMSKAFSLKL